MSSIFEFLFGQYVAYESTDIILEIVAVLCGFASVWFSKQNNILVFPTGIVSTVIFVYLLLKWDLLGDMMINAYYFVMSIYGWYIWTKKDDAQQITPITRTTGQEKKMSIAIFIAALIFVFLVYLSFNKWTSWVANVDTFTTAVFFVAMWLMAKKKLENWIFWIIGDVISVPLYFYKGFTFTSFQYLGFTIIAIYGYLAWKRNINNNLVTA